MRFVTASQHGSPDVLFVEERPVPQPGPGEVVVEVKAAGLNLMDTYVRRGMPAAHFNHEPPLILGVDGAGIVTAAGDQATAKVGDRVAWVGVPGSYADMVAVPNDSLVPIPEGVSFEAAAGGLMQGMTAQYLTQVSVPVWPDAVVLVHSAGSGVGRMLTQLAAHRGGRVIATVSRAHKAGAAREAGAWQVLVRDEIEDLGSAIRELVGGNGVDVAFDGTGKALFDVSVSVLRVGGIFVSYGYSGGLIPPIDLLDVPHGVHLVRARPDGPEMTAAQWRQRAEQVMGWIEDGTLDVLIDRTYPLEDAAAAHRDLESQETVGKLLLIP
ncbi:quinone oxidoreductase [Nocardia sp. NEAU-G5]|uniref:Quinone oxidoreductase n=1 Tax=Nocardia albiluteola TaxID=2842303 RepID=A0ABS6B8N3_9NOCA|nr:quinone oxidoreductase [Nocardia albiluteola]MBU3066664.1 quinone oxidoreductase [Nocardia albiluteola]